MTNTDQLITLRAAYIARIRELIARHPAQAANEAYYLSRVTSASLGRVKQRIAPKGSPALEVGEIVLVWRPSWSLSDSATVWTPACSCDVGCQSWSVEVVS